MNPEKRKENEKRRRPPRSISALDIMEQRFGLYMAGIKIPDLDKHIEIFNRTFK